MEQSKDFCKNLISLIFPLEDALYFLQLEEYKTARYVRHLPKLISRRNLQRHDTLKNTSHIKVLRSYTLVFMAIWSFATIILAFLVHPILVMLMFLFPLVSIALILANEATMPYYRKLTKNNEQKAKELIETKFKKIKIVGITGSFGKTTTKNFIYELIRHKYTTQMVPGNINTSIGIANWILRELKPGTEILIVEMGAYVKGEIERICQITKPDISVITSLSEQHMDRFKTFSNLIEAKLEIFENASPEALRVIPKKYSYLINDYYSDTFVPVDTDADLRYQNKPVQTNISFPGAIENLHLVLRVAEELNVPDEFVQDSLMKLSLPDRRKDIKQLFGYTVIDDSYNISYQTAIESVKEAVKLAESKNSELVLITAGIPELGESNSDANKKFGEYLKTSGVKLVLLESELKPQIVSGLGDTDQIINRGGAVYSIAEAFSEVIEPQYPDKEDILILMQPELSDLYY